MRDRTGNGSGGPGAVVAVAAGGALGAPLRWGVAQALPTTSGSFPTATFVTNLVGAFALGVLLELLLRAGDDTGGRRLLRLGLGTGALGAFTTYSTLAVEVVLLGRSGSRGLAVSYGLGSALLGLVAAAAGVVLTARLLPRR